MTQSKYDKYWVCQGMEQMAAETAGRVKRRRESKETAAVKYDSRRA